MLNQNQILTLLVPITALIWLAIAIYQLRTKRISSRTFIIYFILGLVICMGAALRDGYGFSESSLIPISSTLSAGLSLLGLSLFVITVIGVLSKNKLKQAQLFMFMLLIFVIKFVVVQMIGLGQLL